MLKRKGMTMNHKKLYRLYTEEKLGVRRRRGRKRARGSRTPMADEGRDVDAERHAVEMVEVSKADTIEHSLCVAER